jgi:hypothetical protein
MKTIIILLDNRKLLEMIENQVFENTHEMIDQLKEYGMTEKEERDLTYYEISEFMDLMNDQILDDFQNTFLGYIKLNK